MPGVSLGSRPLALCLALSLAIVASSQARRWDGMLDEDFDQGIGGERQDRPCDENTVNHVFHVRGFVDDETFFLTDIPRLMDYMAPTPRALPSTKGA